MLLVLLLFPLIYMFFCVISPGYIVQLQFFATCLFPIECNKPIKNIVSEYKVVYKY